MGVLINGVLPTGVCFMNITFRLALSILILSSGCTSEEQADESIKYFLAQSAPAGGESDANEYECLDCVKVEYVAPSGRSVSVQRDADVAVAISYGEIRNARIQEFDASVVGEPRLVYVVRLDVSAEFSEDFDAMWSDFPGLSVLVVGKGGRALGFEPLSISRYQGFPGGVFKDKNEAIEYYSDAGVRVSVLESRGGDAAAEKEEIRIQMIEEMKRLQCDSDYREAMKVDGLDPDRNIEELRALYPGIDDEVECGVKEDLSRKE